MMKLFIIITFGMLLCSCEKLLFENEITNNQTENFEYFWKECDEKYSLFKYKGVDWDEVYQKYKPKVYNIMSDDSLFNVLSVMLKELKDGHVSLQSPFNSSTYFVGLQGPENINIRLIIEQYLGEDFYYTASFAHNFIADNKVGYIRFWEFRASFADDELDFILNRYKNTRGLIIDLRQNGGGLLTNVFKILDRFTDKKLHIYNLFVKNGPGHEDFHDADPAYINPSESIRYTKKVAVLVDRESYSATSTFALGIKSLSNTFLVGDTTGGGLGLPRGGQLPNGWIYRFSTARFLTPDGKSYENGVPPDIYVVLNDQDVNNGIDTVIEKAVQELLK